MKHTITVEERDGISRRVYPCTVSLGFPQGALRRSDPVRLTGVDGEELPVQVDPVGEWDDGSVCKADVTFCPTIGACETQRFELACGGTPPEATVRNPLTVRVGRDAAEVVQGPVGYTVRVNGFNLVDRVVFGDKSFLKSGARGLALLRNDGETCVPEGEVNLSTGPHGPWWGRVLAEGHLEGGYGFTCRLDFVSGKSWYLVDVQLSSGDLSQVQAIIFEQVFDLPEAPLSTAFGSRTTAEGVPTNWSVTTDGAHTVDVAALDAWVGADSVRHEVDPKGEFRLIFPYTEGRACRAYYHYLGCPPDDTRNTSAAAMAAPLACTSD
jgi:hypothetical protein